MRYRAVLTSFILLLSWVAPVTAATPRFRPISLPADAQPHARAANEWWYFTGHLRDRDGHRFGFEMTTFKIGKVRAINPFAPADTLYRIDFAVTDEQRRTFRSMVDYAYPAPGKAELAARTLASRITTAHGSLRITTLPGPGLAYRLRGGMAGGKLDLTVRTTRPPLLENGNGIEQLAGGYSYYYSLTNMRSAGTLTLGGRAVAVTGTTWMDHQWGNWDWKLDKGWDFMAIQLTGGTSLSLVNFASGHGATYTFASVSYPSGKQGFTKGARVRAVGRVWVSPATHVRYPAAWQISVPSIGLQARVTPSMAAQEMVDPAHIVAPYWEGSCRLVGTLRGKPITGNVYTELVGYGPKGFSGF